MVDEQPQLHDLTKFLLDRLKTYPEEFVAGRWEYEISVIDMVDAGNNRKALNDALDTHRMDMVLKKALEKLLTDEKPKNKLTIPGDFKAADRDLAAQTYVLTKHDGTTVTIPQDRVDDYPSLLATVEGLIFK